MKQIKKTFLTIILAYFIGFGGFAQSPAYRWGNLKIGGGGYVTGIAIHPKDKNIIYIRTDVGGAYKWDVNAKKWVQLLNWIGPDNSNLIGVDGMALDPNNPDRIYLALGRSIKGSGGIFRSDDQGKTWVRLMAAFYEGNGRAARWMGECLAVDPNSSNIIYAGTRKDGLWRSTDDGKNWLKVPDVPAGFTGESPTGVRSVIFDPSEKVQERSSVIYIGVPGSGIFISKDGGDSFSLMAGSPVNPARMQIVNRELFVTHDKGVTSWSGEKWHDITPVPGKNYVAVAVDETDSRKLVVAERYGAFYNPIYRSNDKGQTWKKINTKESPANLHVNIPWWSDKRFSSATSAMAFVPGTSGELYYTDWFGVWQTPDIWAKSTDWYTLVSGHEETVLLTLVSPPSGALVYSGMADVSGFRHDDLQSYPKNKLCPLNEGFSISVCEKSPSHLAVLGARTWGGDQTHLYTSSDFGDTWTERKLPEGSTLGRIAVSANEPDCMVYVKGGGEAYFTTNRGDSWLPCHNAPKDAIKLTDIWGKDNVLAADLIDEVFYLFQDGTLFASANKGADWVAKNKLPIPNAAGYINVVPAPELPGEVWISLDKNGLWRTSDGGNTFNQVKAFTTASAFTWGAAAPGSNFPTAYCYGTIGDKWGLYRSIDMGNNWIRINDDQHQFPSGVKAIAGDRQLFGRIYIGSGGCGVYYGELDH